MVIVVKKPDARILVIFFKGHGVAVGDVDGAFEGGAEQDADDALASVFGDSVVVVDDAEKHERVNHHLLDWSR